MIRGSFFALVQRDRSAQCVHFPPENRASITIPFSGQVFGSQEMLSMHRAGLETIRCGPPGVRGPCADAAMDPAPPI
jgi:hypothetical protein